MPRNWLTILQGPNKGKEIDLEAEEITIGRHPDCQININDPEVSRKHFKLIKKGIDYWAEDLKSTNGTVINGRPIQAPYRLLNNAKIGLGANVLLVFNKEMPKPEPEPVEQPVKSVREEILGTEKKPAGITRPLRKKPEKKEKEKRDTSWLAWGCFGVLVILALAAAAALYYIDANFLWCELFGQWLPGCW
jgi:pSer/pThr/pTyr-binding forkhead associated (FHA) protein